MFTGNEKVWPFKEQAVPAPRGHKVPVPGDTEGTKMVMDLLRARVEEAGVEVRYETGVTNLVVVRRRLRSSASPGSRSTRPVWSPRRRWWSPPAGS